MQNIASFGRRLAGYEKTLFELIFEVLDLKWYCQRIGRPLEKNPNETTRLAKHISKLFLVLTMYSSNLIRDARNWTWLSSKWTWLCSTGYVSNPCLCWWFMNSFGIGALVIMLKQWHYRSPKNGSQFWSERALQPNLHQAQFQSYLGILSVKPETCIKYLWQPIYN